MAVLDAMVVGHQTCTVVGIPLAAIVQIYAQGFILTEASVSDKLDVQVAP